MAAPSFEQFADMLDRTIERIPDRFIRDLTGGFNLREEKNMDGEYYIMGEYIEEEPLGCFIMFYYGSFLEALQNEPREIWEAEVLETVLHELQHHLEALAGNDNLARKEMAELIKDLSDK